MTNANSVARIPLRLLFCRRCGRALRQMYAHKGRTVLIDDRDGTVSYIADVPCACGAWQVFKSVKIHHNSAGNSVPVDMQAVA